MTEMADDITILLQKATDGDDTALERLMRLIYDELHRLASSHLRRERIDHTLQPTALVNEAYMKLVDQTRVRWESRGHFLSIAATAMRRILVDHARGKSRKKRAAAGERVALEEGALVNDGGGVDLLALDDALQKLAGLDPRKVRVIEMRFFVGLTIDETAEAIGVSPVTVKRDWDFARLWLLRELSDGEVSGAE